MFTGSQGSGAQLRQSPGRNYITRALAVAE
jgi:hypothetical protein